MHNIVILGGNGLINYIHQFKLYHEHKFIMSLAKILDVQFTPIAADSTGELASRYNILSGCNVDILLAPLEPSLLSYKENI